LTEAFEDIFYRSDDGLSLYARDYGSNSNSPVVLCMHGLTRNSSDFHSLALTLKDDFRVISVDQRGRGRSDYDSDSTNYRPDIYCGDMLSLLPSLDLNQVIAIGTSMGGIMAMMMAAQRPGIFTKIILNDIGPEIDPAGLARIKGYIGVTRPFKNWAAATSAVKAQGPEIFPDYTDEDWKKFARRTCVELPDGRVDFAYDPMISEPIQSDDTVTEPVDMWPMFRALHNVPVLTIRGSLSDILSGETVQKMSLLHPEFSSVEIPRVGHAPMLDEPESLKAIDEFLKGTV